MTITIVSRRYRLVTSHFPQNCVVFLFKGHYFLPFTCLASTSQCLQVNKLFCSVIASSSDCLLFLLFFIFFRFRRCYASFTKFIKLWTSVDGREVFTVVFTNWVRNRWYGLRQYWDVKKNVQLKESIYRSARVHTVILSVWFSFQFLFRLKIFCIGNFFTRYFQEDEYFSSVSNKNFWEIFLRVCYVELCGRKIFWF